MRLISAFPTSVAMGIIHIAPEFQEAMGIGQAFKVGQGYLVLALGIDQGGIIYALTQNDEGGFVWLIEDSCTVRPMMGQQPSPLVVPRGMKIGVA